MSTSNYIETLQHLDQSTIVSTGRSPNQFKDLLVIGDAPRDAYLYDLENVDSILAADPFRSDDALILHTPQGQVGVAYHQREDFLRIADDLRSGRTVDPIVKPWSIGPWLPETFASDLSRAMLVRCEDAAVKVVFNSLKTYPEAMGKAIVASCSQEIMVKTGLFARSSNPLARSQLQSDMCLAGIRLLYATERVYFRGMRYSAETRAALSVLAASIALELESPEHYRQAQAAIDLISKVKK